MYPCMPLIQESYVDRILKAKVYDVAIREDPQPVFSFKIRGAYNKIAQLSAICAAIQDIFQDTRSIAEPAGALAVAGIKKYVGRENCTERSAMPCSPRSSPRASLRAT